MPTSTRSNYAPTSAVGNGLDRSEDKGRRWYGIGLRLIRLAFGKPPSPTGEGFRAQRGNTEHTRWGAVGRGLAPAAQITQKPHRRERS